VEGVYSINWGRKRGNPAEQSADSLRVSGLKRKYNAIQIFCGIIFYTRDYFYIMIFI